MSQDPALTQWLALLNRATHDCAVLSADILVRYYPAGRGGPSSDLEGIEAVRRWMLRGPDGRFQYRAEAASPCALVRDLANGERALSCRFEVREAATDWVNRGDWTLHLSADQIVAVLHVPDPLDP